MIGPCWMIDRTGGECQYWVGPHVITPATENLGPGRWRDEDGEHYCPPDPARRICPGAKPTWALQLGAEAEPDIEPGSRRGLAIAILAGMAVTAAVFVWVGTRDD